MGSRNRKQKFVTFLGTPRCRWKDGFIGYGVNQTGTNDYQIPLDSLQVFLISIWSSLMSRLHSAVAVGIFRNVDLFFGFQVPKVLFNSFISFQSIFNAIFNVWPKYKLNTFHTLPERTFGTWVNGRCLNTGYNLRVPNQ